MSDVRQDNEGYRRFRAAGELPYGAFGELAAPRCEAGQVLAPGGGEIGLDQPDIGQVACDDLLDLAIGVGALAAIDRARPGDVVVIAGKGHETYRDREGVKTPFLERELLEEYAQQIGLE